MKLTSGNIRNLAEAITDELLKRGMIRTPSYIVQSTVKKAIKECFGIDTRESV